MEIIEGRTGKRCEMGRCRNRADLQVRIERMGIRSTFYICRDCAKELYGALGARLVPKSIETLGALKRAAREYSDNVAGV